MPVVALAPLSEWDVAKWDEGAWVSTTTIYRPWAGVTGLGFAGALRLLMSSSTQTTLIAYEVVYETGGVV